MSESFEGNKVNMSKEDAKSWIEYCDTIERLKQNPDFQKFIEVYTRSEILRGAYLLTDVSITMNRDKDQIEQNIINDIKASSSLRNYLVIAIPRQRELAQKTLDDYAAEENRAVNGGE